MILVAHAAGMEAGALDQLADSLPLARRERAERFARPVDRASCIVVHALLEFVWNQVSRDPLPPITTGRWGKPRFAPGTPWQFNLSHDAGVCVCVLARSAVGIDVQSRVRFDAGMLARFAAPAELTHEADYRAADDLSALWTRKEAVVKRTGRGIGADLGSIDTTRMRDLRTYRSDAFGVHLSVSARGIAAAPPEFVTLTRKDSRWQHALGDGWGELGTGR
ncbi:MAG: 4'-phosphopantetheinyl transferase family protein [Actinomycetales bacterium]